MKRCVFLIASFCFFITTISAQKNPNLALTADSLATGNYKDVLNSFFQLAFDKIVGADKEIRFTSNPFAVMAKMNPALLVDTHYYKYRKLRDLNFSFALKLDTGFRFNGFSAGLKYALVNKRDETVSRAFLIAVENSTKDLFSLNNSIEMYISSLANDTAVQNRIRRQKTSYFKGEISLNQLEPMFRDTIKAIAKRANVTRFDISQYSREVYDSVKTLFHKKPLWTLGISDTTYQDQFMFSNIVLASEFLKGFGDFSRQVNFEINAKVTVQFVDDIVKTGRDLQRSILNFEPAFNLVIKSKGTHQSFFEFKLAGSYNSTLSSLYPGEERNRLILNSTVRVRVLNDIWIPVEIKYDPDTGNVFGFLNVRANFNGLSKIVKDLL